MRELFDELDRWRRGGTPVAIARVVDIEGSGPRDPGAAMAVSAEGEVAGSVSGGCVEGAVVIEALDILETGERRVVEFGYSDDEAFAVGLTCGGTIHLFIEPLDWWSTPPGGVGSSLYDVLRGAVDEGRPVALATVIDGPHVGAKLVVDAAGDAVGTVGEAELDRVVARDAVGELAAGTTGVRQYGPCGEAAVDPDVVAVRVFIESFATKPRLLVFGAVDFTAALVRVAKVLGYVVTVCDAREVFATRLRFPEADEVVVDWPHRLLERVGPDLGPRDVVCVLTHDHKFDVPALVGALATAAGYIGAMGSRRTHDERVTRLRDAGVDDAGLARIHAPIGLDIGGRTPEETAVSICAEIIAVRTGRTDVQPLSAGDGPIHT